MREPAVGPLTSFQSLPFINIYSSSTTKNNILEPREQKKINENHRELGLIIMCARAEWNPEKGGRREHGARGSVLPLVVTGQCSLAGQPAAGFAAKNCFGAAVQSSLLPLRAQAAE